MWNGRRLLMQKWRYLRTAGHTGMWRYMHLWCLWILPTLWPRLLLWQTEQSPFRSVAPPNAFWELKDLSHTMDLLWGKLQWIILLYMKPISFQSKAPVVCSITAAIVIDFCLKKLNVFSQHFGKKTKEYLNSAEQIPMNWNVDQLSVLITSWDIT